MSVSTILDQSTGKIFERFIPGDTPHTLSASANYSDIVSVNAIEKSVVVPVLQEGYSQWAWPFDSTTVNEFSLSVSLQLCLTQDGSPMTDYLYYGLKLYGVTSEDTVDLGGTYWLHSCQLLGAAQQIVAQSYTAQVSVPSDIVAEGGLVAIQLWACTTGTNEFTIVDELDDVYSQISVTFTPALVF